MRQSIHEAAETLDEQLDRAHALRAMAREARKHGYTARVCGARIPTHVLVTSSDGGARAFRSASALVAWMGY